MHKTPTLMQRIERAGIAGIGGGGFSLLGGIVGASLSCGPAAPYCIAAGGLSGGLIWGFGLQPVVFEALSLTPTRNVMPLE